MSINIQTVSSKSNKWALTECLAGKSPLPQEVLRSVLRKLIEDLQNISNIRLPSSLLEKAWTVVSKEEVAILQETFFLAFRDHVLGGFTEEQAGIMLQQRRYKENPPPSSLLKTAYASNQKAVIQAIIQKTHSMANGWTLGLIKAAREEGIKLPEPQIRAAQARCNRVSLLDT